MLILKDKCILGNGRARLLEEIDRLGCISEAARELNMPYRVAIRHIRSVERVIGEKLVITRRGGRGGGGRTQLTPLAKEIVNNYKKARRALEEALKELA